MGPRELVPDDLDVLDLTILSHDSPDVLLLHRLGNLPHKKLGHLFVYFLSLFRAIRLGLVDEKMEE